ncbi:hypothetical protein F5148DRAFT_1283934 [Russula earlei]|uniref:Uncharacterized protein n=1 Tax=Russula earlei TaxID=71964 RepID=A0ACC0UAC4_9AGAM|nr:hypothetical protein F5148DRAFT_1283934 [Russula earlei]
MVNFRDPAVIQQDEWAVVKLWHALAGLYFWEFLNTLDYEWSIIKGHRPYRWSIWIYSLTRVAALISVILSLIGVDDSTQYNCQIQNKFQFIFGYLTFATASLLILLRIIAIWNEKKIVIAIATTVWAVNLSFFIRGIVRVNNQLYGYNTSGSYHLLNPQIHSVWVPAGTTCEVTNIQSTKPNIILALATDLVLVGIMLVGLLRLGYHERGAFGIGHLLWKQGLIWLLIATVAEVPPAVFIILNLNEPFNEMFQIPAMIALSIAATRIHRSLTDFAARSTEMYENGPHAFSSSALTGRSPP